MKNDILWFCAIFILLFTLFPKWTNAKNMFSLPVESPTPTIRYTNAMLRSRNTPCIQCQHSEYHDFTKYKQRKRGRKGGTRVKNKRRQSKPFAPSFVLGNTRSLVNKMDELQGASKFLRQYREASCLAFVETWFNQNTSETASNMNNFFVFRSDSTQEADKNRGGGVRLYVNERWANKNNASVKETMCTPNLELLTVNIRPHYLPRELTGVLVNVIYIPPTANETEAVGILTSRIQEQETKIARRPENHTW
ncbi:hypothetical protein ElyMa_004304200 [Elysia marginata]|uniref:Uncharacterized protein n=1 Tax=Elysia marginata TaxID=1093978 RepID=A0AAV4GYF5_9GAST|nr:hypothetical protein ElyMa_004304200 [Elysia marginata]